MSTSSHKEKGGIGLVGLLTIIFVILKLTGTISWSWWWVLSPLWISALLGVAVLLVIGIAFAFGISLITRYVKQKDSPE